MPPPCRPRPDRSLPYGQFSPVPPETVPSQVPAEEGWVKVPKGRLWYRDTGGTGPAIILSHPSSGSALSWAYQQPVLANGGYRVIAFSRRGHYRSASVDPSAPGTGADDVGAVADHLGLKTFHLLGSAGGANAVLDYALHHHERVLSLALLSSYLGITDPDYLRLCESFRPPRLAGISHSFLELSPTYRSANLAGTRAWEEQAAQSLVDPVVPRQPLIEPITWRALRGLRPRTLLMTGESDLFWPPPLLRMVARHLVEVNAIVFHSAGHSAYWERPSAFNCVVMGFLSGKTFPGCSLV